MKFISNNLTKMKQKFCKWTFIVLVMLSSSYTYVMVVSSNTLLFYKKLNFLLLENITSTPEYYDVLSRNNKSNITSSKHDYPSVSSKVFSTVKPPTKTFISTTTKSAKRLQTALNREVRYLLIKVFQVFCRSFTKRFFKVIRLKVKHQKHTYKTSSIKIYKQSYYFSFFSLIR